MSRGYCAVLLAIAEHVLFPPLCSDLLHCFYYILADNHILTSFVLCSLLGLVVPPAKLTVDALKSKAVFFSVLILCTGPRMFGACLKFFVSNFASINISICNKCKFATILEWSWFSVPSVTGFHASFLLFHIKSCQMDLGSVHHGQGKSEYPLHLPLAPFMTQAILSTHLPCWLVSGFPLKLISHPATLVHLLTPFLRARLLT